MLWRCAYVGLGSNLDGPAEQVQRALVALAALPDSRLVRRSPLYGSRPLGGMAQPDYVNAVAGLLTRLPLMGFFEQLQDLQARLGRQPATARWAPRRIDLDLLLFGSQRHATDKLTVPHPGVAERNFVLWPLYDVAPQLRIEGHGAVADMAGALGREGLWPLQE